ncbi:MAG: hypothetical protein HN742_24600 [Lentisphaerae bacterium]|jgi:hypothetical protein|nr:hypothetical protein [Lentisphaerota bacterium]MBT4822440.1 hypothetical protein [Lentisphaerota bacterium]MBT5609748.1 hypothetical protein [Lentisphaerota bacterium]MBT7061390.1 hypothetical protein [Lentisphaerota bacterium]MBT7845080.1 hypothetical protein [Lentisphaerota bacterium]
MKMRRERPVSRLAQVQRHIRRDYSLKYHEQKVIFEDLLMNLEELRTDIRVSLHGEDWQALDTACRALAAVGRNVGDAELGEICGGLAAACERENEEECWLWTGRLEQSFVDLGCRGVPSEESGD